jgi:hypothetical protein
MWFDKLATLRKLEGRIISFIDQPGVIKKILQHIGLWEESHAPPERDPPACGELVEPTKQITFDPSYGSTVRAPHGPEEDRRVKLTVPRKIEGQPQPKADPPRAEADIKASILIGSGCPAVPALVAKVDLRPPYRIASGQSDEWRLLFFVRLAIELLKAGSQAADGGGF